MKHISFFKGQDKPSAMPSIDVASSLHSDGERIYKPSIYDSIFIRSHVHHRKVAIHTNIISKSPVPLGGENWEEKGKNLGKIGKFRIFKSFLLSP